MSSSAGLQEQSDEWQIAKRYFSLYFIPLIPMGDEMDMERYWTALGKQRRLEGFAMSEIMIARRCAGEESSACPESEAHREGSGIPDPQSPGRRLRNGMDGHRCRQLDGCIRRSPQ